MNLSNLFFTLACLFPTLLDKGVKTGAIPGISSDIFNPEKLSEFLYNGGGRAWSTGEKLALKCLLNLYHPGGYEGFNLGHALNTWDSSHVEACITAMTRLYFQEARDLKQETRLKTNNH
ncbi:MAG: hypothetical protein GY696_27030 [Gammaproteobacteria bacterium]|nr:hypothetical protein [Gammaproteobacteria bacterium]